MTSRARMNAAMRQGEGAPPDRVPIMCQLALGHYFLNTRIAAVDIWHDSSCFADALATLQRRYRFDGILVNLPGRDPEWRRSIASIEEHDGRTIVRWREGLMTVIPRDDNPRVLTAEGRKVHAPALSEIEPDRLFYIEPYDRLGVIAVDAFPQWQFDTLRNVRALVPEVSVHAEIFSPFTQLIELLGCSEGMLGLIDDPAHFKASLERLVDGAATLGTEAFANGADAVVMSSAYAGAGFISRRHYEEFVLPYERWTIERIKTAVPGAIVYTHTCGAIGDRLDLMERSGTDGLDALDPPPLGTVDLADARRRLSRRMFIKGNIDPVNTVLRGTPEECYTAALDCIAAAGTSGYILSTACSVPPHAPAENIMALARAAEESRCVA